MSWALLLRVTFHSRALGLPGDTAGSGTEAETEHSDPEAVFLPFLSSLVAGIFGTQGKPQRLKVFYRQEAGEDMGDVLGRPHRVLLGYNAAGHTAGEVRTPSLREGASAGEGGSKRASQR